MADDIPRPLVPRVVVVVLDGVGAGALPDAPDYHDEGSDTLGNLGRAVGGLSLPNLAEMGLGAVHPIPGIPALSPRGGAGLMAEASPGKDTLTGHWELAGLVTSAPIPTYPNGFPPEMLGKFEAAIGGPVLGNKAASGTQIIEELGPEHLATGRPIVYTSADSVFQIAAHEDVIPPDRLYRMCELARELYREPPYLVGRVIARPFVGNPGSFRRTAGRRDYSLAPPGRTLLEDLTEAGYEVTAVGKVKDIFAGRGISRHLPAAGNAAILETTTAAAAGLERGLVFANLVDFDMLYGHRNDPAGYAAALMEFDRALPQFCERLREDDLLIITADHGCDPTTPSTDHSREYVPVLLTGRRIKAGVDLGTRGSLADCGATIAEALDIAHRGAGRSFLSDVLRGD